LPDLDDVTKLIKSINAVTERPIDESRLMDIVQIWWPRLEEHLNAASSEKPEAETEPKRDTNEMVAELLEITRSMQRRLVAEGVRTPFRHDPKLTNPLGIDLDTSIDELDLSVRPHNVLKRAGIDTIGKVAASSEAELVNLRNMGHRAVDEIREKLQELRLDFRED
jgi:DNA-directed RNA polymerase alpha subunit